MRICKQSRVCAYVVAYGLLLAFLAVIPPCLSAGQIATITDPNGQSIYVNGNSVPVAPGYVQSDQVFPGLTKINAIIDRVSKRYEVDPRLVHAMIRVESNYDPAAVSSKGAMGLMQLIPSTAERFGVENPFDPKQNIQGGVSYLKYLLDLFGGNLSLSLAAYNAGEETVIRSGGIPSIPETERYVRAITHLYHSKGADLGPALGSAGNGIDPIVQYVDSEGVIHFTNAE
jgi:Transglycosylase SLT domain